VITFSFYKVSERKPKNGEDIILLGRRDLLGFEYFETKLNKVEYSYLGLDDKGEFTGTFYSEPVENSKEVLYCGNYPLVDDDYWTSLDDYWKAIDTEIPIQ